MRTWILLLACLPLLGKTPEWERAQTLIAANDYRQAAAILEKAPRKDTDNLVLLGEAYFELKKFDAAVDTLEEAAKLAPKSSPVHLWLGRAWGRLAESNKLLAFGRARKSRAAFEKSVELDPHNRDALDDLFEFYLQAPGIVGGGLDKAEKVAKQIASLAAEDGAALLAKVARKRQQ